MAAVAELALAAIPTAQQAQHAEHAAPHVLAFLTAAFGALARTHEAVLGDAVLLSPDVGNPEPSDTVTLWSDDLSKRVVSVTLEDVLPVVLFPGISHPAQVRIACHSRYFSAIKKVAFAPSVSLENAQNLHLLA